MLDLFASLAYPCEVMALDWNTVARPIVALSPMADMTDQAFCRTVRFVNHSEQSKAELIVFREMVSAEAVVRGNEKTLGMTDIHPDERPLVQQLFGSDPDVMARAAARIEAEHHPEGFDINMGCPVYKLVHNFNGAALMNEPDLAARIVERVKRAIRVPLSVKIRTGWTDPEQFRDFARMLERAGADLITMHGRTKAQGYSGQSDWGRIAELASLVSIPVLANGDVLTARLVPKALAQTHVAGVLIARGALGNPWIFRQIDDILAGREPQPITLGRRVDVMKQHLGFHLEQHGTRGVVTFRKHISWYLRGVPGMKLYKERLHAASDAQTVCDILDTLATEKASDEAIATRDSAHPLAGQRMVITK